MTDHDSWQSPLGRRFDLEGVAVRGGHNVRFCGATGGYLPGGLHLIGSLLWRSVYGVAVEVIECGMLERWLTSGTLCIALLGQSASLAIGLAC